MRIAVIHDWLVRYAGSERVLEQILQCFPDADLFSLIDFLPTELRGFVLGKPARTSFIQHLPFAKSHYQKYLPFMPAAIEALDLRDYDLILSSSSAISKGVLTEPRQLHICYLQSRSLRYAYEERFAYSPGGVFGAIQEMMFSRVRVWDAISARRPDVTIANSNFVRRWHAHRYGVDATVIYPPVAVDIFGAAYTERKDDYYVVVSRFEAYKRIPLVVEAFGRMGKRLLVVGGGSEEKQIRKMAGRNVELLGVLPPADVARVVAKARAFVYAGREDFGLWHASGGVRSRWGGGGRASSGGGQPDGNLV
jgi:glycosyltransferase involved in cell wall biosynthesis